MIYEAKNLFGNMFVVTVLKVNLFGFCVKVL